MWLLTGAACRFGWRELRVHLQEHLWSPLPYHKAHVDPGHQGSVSRPVGDQRRLSARVEGEWILPRKRQTVILIVWRIDLIFTQDQVFWRVIFLSGCLALAIAWRLRHRIKSEHLITCFFNRSNVTKYEDYRSRIIMGIAILIALLKTEMVIVFESYRM